MTGGGVMQLVAYGAQDVYLSANPQVTFFKQLYRRHTNFAMESIEQTFNGVPTFAKRLTATIARNGDLVYRVYLQVTLPQVDLTNTSISTTVGDQFRWLNWIGHNLVSFVEVTIGGQTIDRQYGDWLHIWNELTLPTGKQAGYEEMVGNVPQLVNVIQNVGDDGACTSTCTTGLPHNSGESLSCAPEYTVYVPLQFWFNRHAGLAIPLIALQYHDVQINLDMNSIQNLCWSNNPTILDAVNTLGIQAASLYVDYIFLDTDERRRFAQVAHEYLIEQLQYTGEESVTSSMNRIKMSFNHPVKEIIWVVQRDSFVSCEPAIIDPWKGQQPFNYTDYWDSAALTSGYAIGAMNGTAGENPTAVAKIQLNSRDRFSERYGSYFNLVQPYQHHTNIPARGINVYSFALNPEDHQPSGSCNFSRIDMAQLFLTLTPNTAGQGITSKVRIYAVNYNVLRVVSGMGGLAYSN
jgi:hypothetical protein